MKGSYTVKKKYRRWDDPEAWVKQHLYLDLFKEPGVEDENAETGIRYGFRFLEKAPPPDNRHYWFNVGHILEFDSQDRFDEFKQDQRDKLPDDVTRGQMRTFERNLERLYRSIWVDDAVAYYTEHDQDYDRVLDIFVRANEGGTKLSKSDLLLSMVTSKWGGVNAREEIYDFVDRINNDLIRKNNFDKDFIMKTCLVLCDLPVQYKVDNFNNQNLALIQNKWKAIKSAIERSVNLVNSCGVDRDTLTSANALIPIIYYLFQRPDVTLLGSTPFDARNIDAIRRWLIMAMLNNVFGGSSDNVLRDIRRVLQEQAKQSDFPVDAVNAEVAKSGRPSFFNDYTIDNILAINYGRQLTFLALSLLYDEHQWGTLPFHVDHIFPRALFSPRRLSEAGLDTDAQIRYLKQSNRLANLELLLSTENLEKSNQPIENWLETRDYSFKRRHLLPDDPTLFTIDRFEEFVAAREALIRESLKKLFAAHLLKEMVEDAA